MRSSAPPLGVQLPLSVIRELGFCRDNSTTTASAAAGAKKNRSLTCSKIQVPQVVAGSWQPRGSRYVAAILPRPPWPRLLRSTWASSPSNMDTDTCPTDEYTALQKYISTYRDPKAAAQENAAANEDAPAKKAPKWKVGRRPPHTSHGATISS